MKGLLDPEDGSIIFLRKVSKCRSKIREELNLQDENFLERVIWLWDVRFLNGSEC
jgi:hypothetical protein